MDLVLYVIIIFNLNLELLRTYNVDVQFVKEIIVSTNSSQRLQLRNAKIGTFSNKTLKSHLYEQWTSKRSRNRSRSPDPAFCLALKAALASVTAEQWKNFKSSVLKGIKLQNLMFTIVLITIR